MHERTSIIKPLHLRGGDTQTYFDCIGLSGQ